MEPVEWSSVADARRTGFSGAWPVYKDYCIHDGIVEPVKPPESKLPESEPPKDMLSRLYAPTTHGELPNVLAKLHAGTDEDVLRFVRSYGLLGFYELASENGEEPHSLGDPLPWLTQHAKTVRLIMNLWRLVQDADEGGLRRELGKHALLKSGSPIVSFAVGPKVTRKRFILGAAHPKPEIFALTRDIVRSMINWNLAGIGPVLAEAETGLQIMFSFRSLLDVIYYQLATAVSGGRMQRCAAKDCGGLFIQHDPRQRFCPLWLGVQGESPCSLRERQRTYRVRQRALRERQQHGSKQLSRRKRTTRKGGRAR